MIRLANARIVSLSVCFLLSVAAAGAADDQRPASRGGSQTADPQQGPLVLEPVTGGLVIAPDVKVTRLDGDTRALVGVYGGWVFDSGLLVGGGLYGEADGRSTRQQ